MKVLIVFYLFVLLSVINVNSNIYPNPGSITSDSTYTSETDSAVYCIVSGEKISGEGVKLEYLGTDVVFCCTGCEKSFKKNPVKFMKSGLFDPVCGMTKVDKQINSVYNNTKYYFCSSSCKAKFESSPEDYLNKYRSK